ncbi:MAG TPA: translation initiation factor IF-2 [Candidatus Micrarchaeota archaeon]|nr:translation initiation factor IF-2 [Candidatus Micrarchaeota archaeon]
MAVRQPIVVVMGHVDHGKTSLLDRIRSTSVQKREAGAITQHIGASEIPAKDIEAACAGLLEKLRIKLTIPGLLFIDTPGHEAFTSLRHRGGSIADIAILVIDIAQGFQPQTLESIKILKQFKTPFIVAATKIDLIEGWRATSEPSFTDAFAKQAPHVQARFDEAMYGLIGRFYELGFQAERFDRVTDFTKELTIVPVSAKTGEGFANLLMFLAGLSQKFLEGQLKYEVVGPGKGTILEVKEETGLGTTVDMILYDGTIRKNDRIMFGSANGVVTSKVRAILKPNLPGKIKAGEDKFQYFDEAYAAAGIKIFAPDLDGAIAGAPLVVIAGDEEAQKAEIESQIQNILSGNESKGVIVKTDTLGSAEALTRMLADAGIPVKSTRIGKVTKKDVIDAASVAGADKYLGAVLAFSVLATDDAQAESDKSKAPIFQSKVIYELLDNYKKWVEEQKRADTENMLCELPFPVKIKALPGCCFRMKKPAVFGAQVLAGTLKPGTMLMTKAGVQIGKVKAIQKEKKSVDSAAIGDQVAISIEEAVCGKDFDEGDLLYAYINKKSYDALIAHCADKLTADDSALLKEILSMTYTEPI